MLKRLFLPLTIILCLLVTTATAQKDKSKRPSPPATASQKVGPATVDISYSQPSVKGRTIGVDLEPMPGKVWRAGANEATVFQTDKDILVNGKVLPAGKYAFFILTQGDSWTAIFNKTWDQWGAFGYKEGDDQLRVTATVHNSKAFAEKLTYVLDADGTMHVLWGNSDMQLKLQEKL